MNKRITWLAVFLVAGAFIVLPGCKKKEKEQTPPGTEGKEKPAASSEKPKAPEFKVVLTCGMPGHPQFEPGKEPADGKCPVCGMKLIEKKIPASKTQ